MNRNLEKQIFYVPKRGEPIYIRSGFPHAPAFLWIGKTRAPLLPYHEAVRENPAERRP